QEVYGETDPRSAAVYNNFGIALHAAGDAEKARQQFQWALQVFENTYGADHAKIANVVNNLGYVLTGTGDLDGAKTHFERALDVAMERFERALKIDRAVHGEVHPTLAMRLCQMGRLMMEMDNEPAANRCFTRARAIRQALGQNEPAENQ